MPGAIGELLSRIKEARWQWDAGAWKEVVREMRLSAVADHQTEQAGKISYVDPDGRKAWAKWLQSNPVRLGFEIAKFDTSPDLSEREYEELFGRVDRQFEYLHRVMSNMWGACAFMGTHGDIAFPDDESAERVAVWNSEGYRLLLEVAHGGRGTPIVLLLYVVAPAKS